MYVNKQPEIYIEKIIIFQVNQINRYINVCHGQIIIVLATPPFKRINQI